jgi:predicted ATP-dependent serine protease
MDLLSDLYKQGYKVLFISGEMNRIDLYKYVQRYPKFGDIDILFMNEHLDENPKLVIETQLQEGYDVVLGDSFVEIQDTVKESLFMTSTATEKWIIDTMIGHNMGGNDAKKYTTFIMIQQVTKGGNFVGSNKLKHSTTGMIELRYTKSGETYIELSKNRRGPVNKKLYFKLDNPNDVYYDAGRYEMEEQNRAMLDAEKDELDNESGDFDSMFGGEHVNGFIDGHVTARAAGEMEEFAEQVQN